MCIYRHNGKRCKNISVYGFNGKKTHCLKHKSPGMMDNLSKRCQYPNCLDFAIHGFTKPTHCKKHKYKNMDSFEPITCKLAFCENIALYGTDGSKNFCQKHKKENMIKHDNKNCFCGKLSTCGYYDQKPIRCEEHKTDNMINLSTIVNNKFNFLKVFKRKYLSFFMS